jgi:hypothetical protein
MTRNTALIRILAVDDQPVFRLGTASLIAGLILLNRYRNGRLRC